MVLFFVFLKCQQILTLSTSWTVFEGTIISFLTGQIRLPCCFIFRWSVWIYKLIWTPVFAWWAPHVRCHLDSLSSLGWQNAKSEKCDVVETLTLDPWPSHVSVVHMTQIWTYFLPLKDWDWKSKQLQTLKGVFFLPHVPCVRIIRQWGVISPSSELYSRTFFFSLSVQKCS